jgi:hypothetical protein
VVEWGLMGRSGGWVVGVGADEGFGVGCLSGSDDSVNFAY